MCIWVPYCGSMLRRYPYTHHSEGEAKFPIISKLEDNFFFLLFLFVPIHPCQSEIKLQQTFFPLKLL